MAFFDFFKNINLFKKQGSVVGIDIGSSSIKIVQLKKEFGVAKLETYGEIALGHYGGMSVGQAVSLSPEKKAEALKDLFKQINITTTEASFSVPLRSSLFKLIDIPKVSDANLDQVIQLEARKYIPVPISEVVLEWLTIPQRDFETPTIKMGEDIPAEGPKKIEQTEVLIVAIHKNVIYEYEDIIKRANLTATPLEIETFSASRAVLSNEISALAIVDIGASSSRLFILDYGVARSSHVIGKGSQDITTALQTSLNITFAEAEEAKRRLGAIGLEEGGDLNKVISPTLEFIFYECQKILLNYQKKYSRPISKVILTGGGSQLKGIVELAKTHFEVEVELGNSFKKVQVPAIMEKQLAENGSGFSIATGLALRGLQ